MGRGFLSEGMGTSDLVQSQGHFSFQTGAIKSTDGVQLPRPPRQFQFQTGAIKSVGNLGRHASLGWVSIPNWCD